MRNRFLLMGLLGGAWIGVFMPALASHTLNINAPTYPSGTAKYQQGDSLSWSGTFASSNYDSPYYVQTGVYASGGQEITLLYGPWAWDKGGYVEEEVAVPEGCHVGAYFSWQGGSGGDVYTGYDGHWGASCPLLMADGTTQMYTLCFQGKNQSWVTGVPDAYLMFTQNPEKYCGNPCSPAQANHCAV